MKRTPSPCSFWPAVYRVFLMRTVRIWYKLCQINVQKFCRSLQLPLKRHNKASTEWLVLEHYRYLVVWDETRIKLKFSVLYKYSILRQECRFVEQHYLCLSSFFKTAAFKNSQYHLLIIYYSLRNFIYPYWKF